MHYNSQKCCELDWGFPTSGPQTHTFCQISSGIRLETKSTINVMCLNHSETISPPRGSMEEFSSAEPVPGARKVGNHWLRYKDSIAGEKY